jgi:hypothetical protein
LNTSFNAAEKERAIVLLTRSVGSVAVEMITDDCGRPFGFHSLSSSSSDMLMITEK